MAMPINFRPAGVVALSGVALLHVLYYQSLFSGLTSNLSTSLYQLPALVALSLAALRINGSKGNDRLGWVLICLAVAMTGTLDLLWEVATRINGEEPGLASPFDPFYLVSYVVYIVAIGLLTSPLWKREDRRWMFDAGALLVVAAGLLWHFVIPRTNDGDLLEGVVGAAYLLLDLCFLATVLVAAYTGRLTLRNGLLMAAAAVFGGGDILYYFDTTAYDLSWLIGVWFIAISATIRPEIAVRVPQLKFARSAAVPYVFVAICAVTTIIEMRRGDADELLVAGILALGLVVARQIVSLRRALAVQQQETAFREAVLAAQSDSGLGMAILQGRRVVYANAAAERISGYTLEQLKSLTSVNHLDQANERPSWLAWLDNPELPEETVLRRRDGTTVDLEIAGRLMPGPGEPQLLVVARDITARKQADRALAQAQKFEGLGALAGGVAHDFNNLLSAVLGNVGLLEMGDLDDESEESVASIKSAAIRGAELTRRLLDFARVHPEGYAEEDLRECLLETTALARAAMPVNVRLEVDAGDMPILVSLNRGQMVQAILNLVLNARDAVGERGEVCVSLNAQDGEAELTIRDSGPGMDEETKLRMFEPFFTTKAVGAGTGLGLAITHRTVREHRGSLTVESALGRGTTLTVRLPLSTKAA